MINQEKAAWYKVNAEACSLSAAETMYAILSTTFNGDVTKSEFHRLFEFMKNREKMIVEADACKSDGEKEVAKNTVDNNFFVLKRLTEDDLRARGLLRE